MSDLDYNSDLSEILETASAQGEQPTLPDENTNANLVAQFRAEKMVINAYHLAREVGCDMSSVHDLLIEAARGEAAPSVPVMPSSSPAAATPTPHPRVRSTSKLTPLTPAKKTPTLSPKRKASKMLTDLNVFRDSLLARTGDSPKAASSAGKEDRTAKTASPASKKRKAAK